MPRWSWTRFFVGLGVVALIVSACSPMYVIKAGIAEAKILRARQPLHEVILDPETDERTKAKLTFVVEARQYAIEVLRLKVGDSYTSFTQLDKDTLALVLSAATRDRFASKTWWFPVVGRVPYKGYFDEGDALRDQQELEDDGFDTYLRPTAAFSTLGWFADPLLSTLLRRDEVDLVETVLHELSHAHLFVRGQVGFNESFATFVGRVGAIEFFCNRQGGGPDTVKCLRAQARWRDYQRFSTFIDGLVKGAPGALRRHDPLLRREAGTAPKPVRGPPRGLREPGAAVLRGHDLPELSGDAPQQRHPHGPHAVLSPTPGLPGPVRGNGRPPGCGGAPHRGGGGGWTIPSICSRRRA